jgi:hypothetical protein
MSWARPENNRLCGGGAWKYRKFPKLHKEAIDKFTIAYYNSGNSDKEGGG